MKKKKSKKNKLIPAGRKLEHFVRPMLAKETEQAFNDSEWIYEVKWDGYRAIAETAGEKTKLYSRNGLSFLERYHRLTQALKKIKRKMVLDGEIVVLNKKGISQFQLLQHYENDPEKELCYYVFDLLYLQGKNICSLPLLERKVLLKKYLPDNDLIRYSDHIEKNGIAFFKQAVKKNLEGIMAKKADGEYLQGARSGNWLKIKHFHTEEVIIAGYTSPRGSRKFFGALVLGVYDKKTLRYVGHTGTGFDYKTLADMHRLLSPLVQKKSPFIDTVITNQPVTWVNPKLVCEVKMTEWTSDLKMRHPVFLRLRNDKKPADVTLAEAGISAKLHTK
jgi:bifunctional non-homologous end joining protein LigD